MVLYFFTVYSAEYCWYLLLHVCTPVLNWCFPLVYIWYIARCKIIDVCRVLWSAGKQGNLLFFNTFIYSSFALGGQFKPVASVVVRSPIFGESAEYQVVQARNSLQFFTLCPLNHSPQWWVLNLSLSFRKREDWFWLFSISAWFLHSFCAAAVPVFSVNHVATECNTRVHQSVHQSTAPE